LGDPHGRLEDNISKDVKGAAYEGVDWINLDQDKVKWGGSCGHGNRVSGSIRCSISWPAEILLASREGHGSIRLIFKPFNDNAELCSLRNRPSRWTPRFLFFFSHGVRLSPLVTAATVWPLVPAPDDDDDCGALGGMRIYSWKRNTRSTQYHFVHHQPNMSWLEPEPGPPR
jgi:hypothetical protein